MALPLRLDAFDNYKKNRSSSAGATVRSSAKFDAIRKPRGSNRNMGQIEEGPCVNPRPAPLTNKCAIWTLNKIDKRLYDHFDVAAS